MGGKSRKTGSISKALIDRVKAQKSSNSSAKGPSKDKKGSKGMSGWEE